MRLTQRVRQLVQRYRDWERERYIASLHRVLTDPHTDLHVWTVLREHWNREQDMRSPEQKERMRRRLEA